MVSIIIPHYNRSLLLKQTVDSVLAQTNKSWELIIVDDGSDDEEYDAVLKLKGKDKRIAVLKRVSAHKGPSACRNEGVAAAQGGYLLFLDSDDLLEPFCIDQRLMLMKQNPELEMGIFLMAEFTRIKSDSTRIYNNNLTANKHVHAFLEGNNPWTVTCPIWSKNFFLKCGGFDETLLYMEDPELHVRALLTSGMRYNTFYDFPADCFYRVNYHDAAKVNFYENSILYRIRFYRKTEQLITNNKNSVLQLKRSFEKGVINFFHFFLIS
ncbi:MAG: glycosyltransferase family 2 protein, partial [Ferruginibacter sp.]